MVTSFDVELAFGGCEGRAYDERSPRAPPNENHD
jgi:hypothetical protein